MKTLLLFRTKRSEVGNLLNVKKILRFAQNDIRLVIRSWSLVICLFSLLSAPCSVLHAQTSVELFQKGNAFYRQGKFLEAAQMYGKIISSGEESGELYFNAGNAYFKTAAYAQAIVHYERAKKFIPNDEAVNFNIQLANLHVIDNVEAMPSPLYWELWNSVKTYFSLNQLAWFIIISFSTLLAAVAVFLFTRSFIFKRVFLLCSIIALACALSFAIVLVGKVMQESALQFGIIMTEVVNAKTTPDENGGDAFVIHSGLKVQLLDTVSDWREIKLADGKIGWVKVKEFEEI